MEAVRSAPLWFRICISDTKKFSQPYTSLEEGTKNNSTDRNQSKLFWKLMSSGMWCRLVWLIINSLSEERASSHKCYHDFFYGGGGRKFAYKLPLKSLNTLKTSQETHCISATKTDWLLMLFRETVSVYCENTKHTNTLWGQNAEFCCIKAGDTYSNHLALKGFYWSHYSSGQKN
jgi:hypothetical protein